MEARSFQPKLYYLRYSSDRKDKEKVNSIFLITILLKEIRKK